MTTMHRSGILLALCLTLLLSACDVTTAMEDVRLKLSVEDVPVRLGAGKGSVAVTGGQTTAANSTVHSDLGIKSIDALKQIQLRPDFFSFSPAAGKLQGEQGSGTLSLFLFLGGVPVPGSPVVVTVSNHQVVAVSPASIQFAGATIDRAAVEQALNSLPAEQRPALSDWKGMSAGQVLAEINGALAKTAFPLSLVVMSSGDIHGELTLQQFSIDAEVTR